MWPLGPLSPAGPLRSQGQVQGGLRSGIRIAQGSYFRVTLLKATPVQVDGEPWIQAPGHMIISAAGPKVGTGVGRAGPEQAGRRVWCWKAVASRVPAAAASCPGTPHREACTLRPPGLNRPKLPGSGPR